MTSVLLELRQLFEKEHAQMRERYLARVRLASPTDEARPVRYDDSQDPAGGRLLVERLGQVTLPVRVRQLQLGTLRGALERRASGHCP